MVPIPSTIIIFLYSQRVRTTSRTISSKKSPPKGYFLGFFPSFKCIRNAKKYQSNITAKGIAKSFTSSAIQIWKHRRSISHNETRGEVLSNLLQSDHRFRSHRVIRRHSSMKSDDTTSYNSVY